MAVPIGRDTPAGGGRRHAFVPGAALMVLAGLGLLLAGEAQATALAAAGTLPAWLTLGALAVGSAAAGAGAAGLRHRRRRSRDRALLQAAMLERVPYPVFLLDADGRVVLHNQRGRRLATAAGMPADAGGLETFLAGLEQGDPQGGVGVRIDGRRWLPLHLPYALPATTTQLPHSLLCLVDLEANGCGCDKVALRHIAHDLRSPLTTMLALIEEHSERISERPVVPTGIDLSFLDELRRQADYSLRLSRDFLQLSRAEQLNRTQFSPVCLADVAAEAIDQMWIAAEQRAIELVGPLSDAENTWISGDAAMLVRVLVNVIDNAIKYSPRQTRVLTRVRALDEATLEVRVADQGHGIAEADLPHLFDPFVQLCGHQEGAGGVGLGLAFVRSVVERHGGEVSMSSRLGHGSELRIVLPRG